MTHTHQESLYSARKRSADSSRPPGFASTAAYFKRLAQKEIRDGDRRQRLWDVASFYGSLAGIIPNMPSGYKHHNGVGRPVTRAERWHARAEECRTLADCFTDQTCRGQLRELAQEYDRMAVAAEPPCCKISAKKFASATAVQKSAAGWLKLLFAMDRRWLSLARSYEFAERLSNFTLTPYSGRTEEIECPQERAFGQCRAMGALLRCAVLHDG